MGVSGCGKSTIGRRLAAKLGWIFEDADDFHGRQNKAKMARGEALNDRDRATWLQTLSSAIQTWHQAQRPTILACSALKASYRQQLDPTHTVVNWVYLHGSFEQIQARLMQRQQNEPEHFMSPELLQSQFEALEEPENAHWIEISQSAEAIVEQLWQALKPLAIAPGVVLTTVGSREEGEAIAQALITENLAACINLYPITSVYRWQGKVCNDTEIQLVIKTDLHRFEPLRARIAELHSYDLPEIIALPIAQGEAGYLHWMAAQLGY